MTCHKRFHFTTTLSGLHGSDMIHSLHILITGSGRWTRNTVHHSDRSFVQWKRAHLLLSAFIQLCTLVEYHFDIVYPSTGMQNSLSSSSISNNCGGSSTNGRPHGSNSKTTTTIIIIKVLGRPNRLISFHYILSISCNKDRTENTRRTVLMLTVYSMPREHVYQALS